MFPICRYRAASKSLVCAVTCAAPLVSAALAKAAECGEGAPDYKAHRTVAIGGETKTIEVYVSGSKLREEEANGGHKLVVLRLPERGLKFVYDPQKKEGLRLPLPTPPNSKQPTRTTVDRLANGTFIRHLQIQNGSEWQESSTTTCRTDRIMTGQTFTWFDRHGNLETGKLTQSDIVVGPLPEELFEVPAEVTLRGPPG